MKLLAWKTLPILHPTESPLRQTLERHFHGSPRHPGRWLDLDEHCRMCIVVDRMQRQRVRSGKPVRGCHESGFYCPNVVEPEVDEPPPTEGKGALHWMTTDHTTAALLECAGPS
jgi:hypothetical protein